MNRRSFVATVPASLLVGCLGRPMSEGESISPKNASKMETRLQDWQPSVRCNEERNDMYDSAIYVTHVRASLGDDGVAVHFSALSSAEREMLRTVTEDGGYGTCDVSDAFTRFQERLETHAEGLDRRHGEHVYLERDGVYYLLEINITDQGFVY